MAGHFGSHHTWEASILQRWSDVQTIDGRIVEFLTPKYEAIDVVVLVLCFLTIVGDLDLDTILDVVTCRECVVKGDICAISAIDLDFLSWEIMDLVL